MPTARLVGQSRAVRSHSEASRWKAASSRRRPVQRRGARPVVAGGAPAVGDALVHEAAVQELSGLGDAFDLPVSSYLQGMRARLGFATAAQRDIDLLLLDEVHEALDHEFRAVVAERAEAIRARGGIVVAAGHDHATLETLCDRAIRLADGAIVADGAFADVVDAYAPRA